MRYVIKANFEILHTNFVPVWDKVCKMDRNVSLTEIGAFGNTRLWSGDSFLSADIQV